MLDSVRKRARASSSLIVLVGLLAALLPGEPRAETFPIGEVLGEIRRQIEAARGIETGDPPLRIDDVSVSLYTQTKASASGGIELWVVSAKAGVAESRTSKLGLEIVPTSTIVVSGGDPPPLAAAIIEAKRAVREELPKPPSFKLKSVTFEFEVSIEAMAEGGVKLEVIEVGADVTATRGHRVTVRMVLDV